MASALGVIANAVSISALYAVVAIGFTLIFGVGGVLNLAHGASITVGAYAAFVASSYLGSLQEAALHPVLLAAGTVPVALLVGAVFSGLLYLAMIRYVEGEPIMVMILTLVTAVAMEQLTLNLFGPQPKFVPSLLPGSVTVAGTQIQQNTIAVFVISWLIIGALFLFVNRTKTGKAVLAVSMSSKGAALVGIDARKVNLATWLLAGALAGFAGMLLASRSGASFVIGRNPLVLSFSIVIVGGIGSIRGSVVGAYLIGTLEVLTTSLIDPRLQGLTPLVALILVLLVKPEGLYGRELAHE